MLITLINIISDNAVSKNRPFSKDRPTHSLPSTTVYCSRLRRIFKISKLLSFTEKFNLNILLQINNSELGRQSVGWERSTQCIAVVSINHKEMAKFDVAKIGLICVLPYLYQICSYLIMNKKKQQAKINHKNEPIQMNCLLIFQ
jgi:hypothetical protein